MQNFALSTRLAARPIWDKTKNKYIRCCDAKMVEALWLAYSISVGQSERFLPLGERLGIPYCLHSCKWGIPFHFLQFYVKIIKWFSAYAFHKMKDHLQGIVTLCFSWVIIAWLHITNHYIIWNIDFKTNRYLLWIAILQFGIFEPRKTYGDNIFPVLISCHNRLNSMF